MEFGEHKHFFFRFRNFRLFFVSIQGAFFCSRTLINYRRSFLFKSERVDGDVLCLQLERARGGG